MPINRAPFENYPPAPEPAAQPSIRTYSIQPDPSWAKPSTVQMTDSQMEARVRSIVTASAQGVHVAVEEGGRFVAYATYRLRAGSHGHRGVNHRPNCPVIRILARSL